MRWLLCALLLSFTACRTMEVGGSSVDSCNAVPGTVTNDGFEVQYVQFRPGEFSDRAVVIMPPTGGVTFLESRYAALFCKSGFSVYVVKAWTAMTETSIDLAVHNRLFGRAQRAIERVLRQAVPEAAVGLLGTSVGGLHTATAVGHLERVSAAFVIAAGAPVADVLAHTGQDALKALRERRMREFGFTDREAYRDALAAEFHWEPLAFAAAARQKPLGMVIVQGDETVPTPFQERLRDAWQPSVDYSVSGFPLGAHPVGIFQAWWSHAEDILAFFSRHVPGGPGPALPDR